MSEPSPELDFDAIRCLSVPLADKLAAQANWSAAKYPAFRLLYDSLVERLGTSDAAAGALQTGAPLQPFVLPDTDGRLVNSADLLRAGPLVVSFNRGHWCPYCLLELLALEDIQPGVRGLGGSIISITPQRVPPAKKLKDLCKLTFPVLCDIDNSYALECGLMMSIGPAVDQAYRDFGIDLASDQGNEGLFLPMPATYVVGHDGIILAHYLQPDFRTRMAPRDILAALGAVNN